MHRYIIHSRPLIFFFLVFGFSFSASAKCELDACLSSAFADVKIIGKVIDRATNAPIKGALVYLDDMPDLSGVTDRKGEFVILIEQKDRLALGDQVDLEVEARGYQGKQVQLNIAGKSSLFDAGTIKVKTADSGLQHANSDRTISLIGILLDERSRQPIDGDISFKITIPGKTNVALDQSGIFTIQVSESRFNAANGKFSLSINAPGYGTNITEVAFSLGRQFYDFGVLTLSPDSEIIPSPDDRIMDEGIDFNGSTAQVRSDENALFDIQTAYNSLKQTELNSRFNDIDGLDILKQLFRQYEASISRNHLQTLADNRRERYHRVLTGMENYREEYLARSARVLRHNLEGYDLEYLKSEEFEGVMTNLGETLSYLRQFFKTKSGPEASKKIEEIDDYLYIINKYFNL